MLVVLLLRLCMTLQSQMSYLFYSMPNMDPSSADKPLAITCIFAWTTHEVLETDSFQHLMCFFRRCGAVFSWASCFESCALDIQPYLLRFGVWIYLNIFRSQKQASKHLSDETLQQLKQFGASQSYEPLLTLLWTPWSWFCQYGCFVKCWYPTTMGFPTKNDHFGYFGVFWYHHLRKRPYHLDVILYLTICTNLKCDTQRRNRNGRDIPLHLATPRKLNAD